MSTTSYPVRWRFFPSTAQAFSEGWDTPEVLPPGTSAEESIIIWTRVRHELSVQEKAVQLYVGPSAGKPDYISWGMDLADLTATFNNAYNYWASVDILTFNHSYWGLAFVEDVITLDDSVFGPDVWELDVYWCIHYPQKMWVAEIIRPNAGSPWVLPRHPGLGNAVFDVSVSGTDLLVPLTTGTITRQVRIDDTIYKDTGTFHAIEKVPVYLDYDFGPLFLYRLNAHVHDAYGPGIHLYAYRGLGQTPSPLDGFSLEHDFGRTTKPAPRVEWRVYDHEGRDTGWRPAYLSPVPDVKAMGQDEEFQLANNTTVFGGAVLDASPSWHPEGAIESFSWRIDPPGTSQDIIRTGPIVKLGALLDGGTYLAQLEVTGHNTRNLDYAPTYLSRENVFQFLSPVNESAITTHPTGAVVRSRYEGRGEHNEPEGKPAVGTRLFRSIDGQNHFEEIAALRLRGVSVWHDGNTDLNLFGKRYEDNSWRTWKQRGWDNEMEEVGVVWDENYIHATLTPLAGGLLLSMALLNSGVGRGDLYSKVSYDNGAHWSEPVLVQANTFGRWAVCDKSAAFQSRILATNGTSTKISDDTGQTWSSA